MAENQVAVVAANTGSFPIATKDELSSFTFLGENALEIVRENLGEEPMSPNDFDRAKFPTGGGLSWAVPDIDGSDKPEATIEGIILLKKISRVFWAEDFSGAGARPDCQSHDLEYGVGAPGVLREEHAAWHARDARAGIDRRARRRGRRPGLQQWG